MYNLVTRRFMEIMANDPFYSISATKSSVSLIPSRGKRRSTQFMIKATTFINRLTHIMHIQLAVHQSNTLLDTQWRPSQAMKKKNGGNPKAGTGPIVIPSSTKQNAPSLPRICRWNRLNLLEASSGDRGGFWLLHRFTTGSVMVLVRLQCSSKM